MHLEQAIVFRSQSTNLHSLVVPRWNTKRDSSVKYYMLKLILTISWLIQICDTGKRFTFLVRRCYTFFHPPLTNLGLFRVSKFDPAKFIRYQKRRCITIEYDTPRGKVTISRKCDSTYRAEKRRSNTRLRTTSPQILKPGNSPPPLNAKSAFRGGGNISPP